MSLNLAQKLITAHVAEGTLTPGTEIALNIDQIFMSDGTGPNIVSELEVIGLDRVRVSLAATYIDHNLLQIDHKSADDHEYLRSASAVFGMWHSPAGNGIAHAVHYERFARPGQTLLGADSHTVAAGGLGMLAFGAGGLDVALAAAGAPYRLRMPEIWRMELTGSMPSWVSAKDLALELLRRYGVAGAAGRIIEYSGPGLAGLSAWDRHVLANMGTELGATTTVFPADAEAHRFLSWQGRAEHWRELAADAGAEYDHDDTVDLSALSPLVAKPSSPGNVVPVEQVAGTPIAQAYVGSSSNPGYRDFGVVAEILAGHVVPAGLSLEINPSTRHVLAYLVDHGYLSDLLAAGARLHQAGCNGCVGIGQAPASGVASIRTTPRNFPGRTGTVDDRVFLASPETVAASALYGRITDPRTLSDQSPTPAEPGRLDRPLYLLQAPPPPDAKRTLVRGPNIKPMPRFDPLPDRLRVTVGLVAGDDVSTDEIMPMQQDQLAWRSNIDAVSGFAFGRYDPGYVDRVRGLDTGDGHCIVAGLNYGQGSAREHAALSPRYLGLRVVLARGFARIHMANLANVGVVPLLFVDQVQPRLGDVLLVDNLHSRLRTGREFVVSDITHGRKIRVRHGLSDRQVETILAGGVLELARQHAPATASTVE